MIYLLKILVLLQLLERKICIIGARITKIIDFRLLINI